MEHTLTSGAVVGDRPRPVKNYLNETKGIWSWMSTVDHKRIGIMYLCAVCFAFLLGGIFALLVRLSLLNPQHTLFGKHWVTAEMYNRFFTLHGAIMVFLFIIPAIPASLANFVLPMMLGAKDVAFPRINLMSFYLWCGGATLAIGTDGSATSARGPLTELTPPSLLSLSSPPARRPWLRRRPVLRIPRRLSVEPV